MSSCLQPHLYDDQEKSFAINQKPGRKYITMNFAQKSKNFIESLARWSFLDVQLEGDGDRFVFINVHDKRVHARVMQVMTFVRFVYTCTCPTSSQIKSSTLFYTRLAGLVSQNQLLPLLLLLLTTPYGCFRHTLPICL